MFFHKNFSLVLILIFHSYWIMTFYITWYWYVSSHGAYSTEHIDQYLFMLMQGITLRTTSEQTRFFTEFYLLLDKMYKKLEILGKSTLISELVLPQNMQKKLHIKSCWKHFWKSGVFSEILDVEFLKWTIYSCMYYTLVYFYLKVVSSNFLYVLCYCAVLYKTILFKTDGS